MYLVGVEMTYPFETLYLNGELGVSMTTLGLILGITLFATLPMQVVGGTLCDRVGRRPVLVIAMLGSMTLYVGLGLTTDLGVIVALIAFEAAFGWAQFITASNAMIADLTPPARRAEAFSISRVALNGGTAIGPLIALPLLALDPSFRLNFFASGSSAASSSSWCSSCCARPGRPPWSWSPSPTPSAATAGSCATVACWRSALSPCCRSTASGRSWSTMPVMLEDLHGVSATRWSVALAVHGVSVVLMQYPVIRALRDRDHMLLLSLACVAQSFGMGLAC